MYRKLSASLSKFTKSEHMVTQVPALSSPVSAVYARNAWDHDPLLAPKNGLHFKTRA